MKRILFIIIAIILIRSISIAQERDVAARFLTTYQQYKKFDSFLTHSVSDSNMSKIYIASMGTYTASIHANDNGPHFSNSLIAKVYMEEKLKWQKYSPELPLAKQLEKLELHNGVWIDYQTKDTQQTKKVSCGVIDGKEIFRDVYGVWIDFQTTDNKRTKSILQRLPNISPIEMLLELAGIEGIIRISYGALPNNWLKKENLPVLVELDKVNIVTPQFEYVSREMMQSFIPEKPMFMYFDTSVNKKMAQTYVRMPLGANALAFAANYFHWLGAPESAKYAGDWISNYKIPVLENRLWEWYKSGKPSRDALL